MDRVARFFRTRHLAFAYLSLIVVLMGGGCDRGPGYPAARLAGRVTVDDEAIAKGTMIFSPRQPGSGPVVTAKISAGDYVADAVPLGKINVEIIAMRETGKMQPLIPSEPNGAQVAELENAIPEQYRNGIEINVTGDDPELDFDLTATNSTGD